MVKIGRNRIARLVVLLCGALAVGSISSGASVAQAGQLEGLPGPVQEVTESVEEVAGGVVPAVQEVTETLTPPVTEIVEKVRPPVTELTEKVAPPVTEVTQTVVPPVKEAVETTTRATREATAKAQEVSAKILPPAVTTPARQPSVPGADPSEAHGEPARSASVPSEADRAGPTTKATDDGDGLPGENFAASSPDGSVRAPLPKWMAYVWPAIALAWPDLTGVLERWERGGERLLLGSAEVSSGGGSHGVAGVHASHDAGAASGSTSSPFAPIPAAVGGFTSHIPGEALAYLAIVAILVAAVFVAVRYEITRQGRG